ncbi:hypothetical protein ACFVUW_10765 [Streptomyces xiamenensis]|uniref:hypothetical protein n=1 Tax=Streptomyces xiamenensis TaxID=408015 RepID=UPI0036E6134F
MSEGTALLPVPPECWIGDDQPMKPRLTFEEHIEMGRFLASIRDELTRRNTQLANAYPRSGREGAPARRLDTAIGAIDRARCELEEALYGEHPAQARVTVYYPQPEDRIRMGDRWPGAAMEP